MAWFNQWLVQWLMLMAWVLGGKSHGPVHLLLSGMSMSPNQTVGRYTWGFEPHTHRGTCQDMLVGVKSSPQIEQAHVSKNVLFMFGMWGARVWVYMNKHTEIWQNWQVWNMKDVSLPIRFFGCVGLTCSIHVPQMQLIFDDLNHHKETSSWSCLAGKPATKNYNGSKTSNENFNTAQRLFLIHVIFLLGSPFVDIADA